MTECWPRIKPALGDDGANGAIDEHEAPGSRFAFTAHGQAAQLARPTRQRDREPPTSSFDGVLATRNHAPMPTLDDVYRKFGEAAEAAQLLETELGNLLLEHDCIEADLLESPDPDKATAIYDRINRDAS